MRIDEFVANVAIERLHLGILGWVSTLNEMKRNVVIGAPAEHSMAAELAAVVTSQSGRQTALESNP
jgi:hypothetical protein